MTKVMVIDGDEQSIGRMQHFFEKLNGFHLVDVASHSVDGLEKCTLIKPDILICDAHVQGADGLELCKLLAQKNAYKGLIITANSKTIALGAYGVHALDFLVKPVPIDTLEYSLQYVRKWIKPHDIQSTTKEHSKNINLLDHLKIKVNEETHWVLMESILYLKAEQKHIVVSFEGGQGLLEGSLTQLQTVLGANFIRIHRNAIVKLGAIDKIIKDKEGQFLLKLKYTDSLLQISRRSTKALRQLLKV